MMTSMFSSKAMSKSSGEESSYFLGWQEYEKNPFHPIRNPSGIIQLGLAENQLSFDLMESWIERNKEDIGYKTRLSADASPSSPSPSSSSSSSSSSSMLFRELALFQDYHGLPAFKKVLAEYMSLQRQKKVMMEADKVVLTAGATSANETLMFCLCEPGEAFLVPTPYYPGFDRDLKWRTGVEIIPIQCSSTNSFRITSQALENSYQISQKLNLKVKGILITNPSNPLGTTLTLSELNHIITFAINKNIHIVSDEIYSSTVFKSPRFVSVLEALAKRNLENASIWKRVHVVSSLSKDLGLPGFRIGMIYSNSDVLISAATKMSSFSLVSSQSQYLLMKVLGDLKFMEFYTKENKKRLRKRHKMIVGGLKKSGISCLGSNAGLFCWVDMRHLLDDCDDFESEMDLWKKMIYEVGLNVSPGSSCHCFEPGWFRVCFSNMDEETLEISMKRIKAFVDSKKVLGN